MKDKKWWGCPDPKCQHDYIYQIVKVCLLTFGHFKEKDFFITFPQRNHISNSSVSLDSQPLSVTYSCASCGLEFDEPTEWEDEK